MTQKKLNICQLLLYIHGKVMVAKQRVKYLNRKWTKFSHSQSEMDLSEYFEKILETRKRFNENIIHFPLDAVFILQIHNEGNKEVSKDIIEITDDIIKNTEIVGMADLGPKAYQGFCSELYGTEFENFCTASDDLFASLYVLQKECEKSLGICIADPTEIFGPNFS